MYLRRRVCVYIQVMKHASMRVQYIVWISTETNLDTTTSMVEPSSLVRRQTNMVEEDLKITGVPGGPLPDIILVQI